MFKKSLIILLVLALATLCGTMYGYYTQQETIVLDEGTSAKAETPRTIIVYVTGEVKKPGLVSLTEGQRVADAVNAVGGVKIGEPAADLAVILAMLSSFRNRPLPEKMVAFGEIGLSGEVRPVARGQERLKEAEKLGFKRAIVPKANMPRNEKEFPNLKIFGVSSLQEAIEICRDAENSA